MKVAIGRLEFERALKACYRGFIFPERVVAIPTALKGIGSSGRSAIDRRYAATACRYSPSEATRRPGSDRFQPPPTIIAPLLRGP